MHKYDYVYKYKDKDVREKKIGLLGEIEENLAGGMKLNRHIA